MAMRKKRNLRLKSITILCEEMNEIFKFDINEQLMETKSEMRKRMKDIQSILGIQVPSKEKKNHSKKERKNKTRRRNKDNLVKKIYNSFLEVPKNDESNQFFMVNQCDDESDIDDLFFLENENDNRNNIVLNK